MPLFFKKIFLKFYVSVVSSESNKILSQMQTLATVDAILIVNATSDAQLDAIIALCGMMFMQTGLVIRGRYINNKWSYRAQHSITNNTINIVRFIYCLWFPVMSSSPELQPLP